MKALSQFRSQVFCKAWQLVKEKCISLSEALKDAWEMVKLQALKALMKLGAVLVTFRKIDGTLTTRKATRNPDLIPAEKQPKYPARPETYIWALPFYSLTDGGWRSLTAQGIVHFKAAQA